MFNIYLIFDIVGRWGVCVSPLRIMNGADQVWTLAWIIVPCSLASHFFLSLCVSLPRSINGAGKLLEWPYRNQYNWLSISSRGSNYFMVHKPEFSSCSCEIFGCWRLPFYRWFGDIAVLSSFVSIFLFLSQTFTGM